MDIGRPIDSIDALSRVLREVPLLEETQLEDLGRWSLGAAADPQALAQQLVERGWLTAYQVKRLFEGQGANLVLGRYVLLEPLGAGGMGEVFKARHQLMGRLVALKVVHSELLSNPRVLQRFRREIQALAQLAHPNIVVAHDAEQVGDRHILVMEYCAGRDLAGVVREKGPLAVGLACEYVRQAALGLQHAHERGLVHRDVKPENLLVAGSVVKVLDLGLARLRLAGETTGPLTQEGMLMGTPDFLSPEQARDVRAADIRSDLYSLGCTFYFLLAGQVPFPGGSTLEKLLRHSLEDPLPLERLRSDVPAAVLDVLRRLLAKDPAGRPQTPSELAAALAPFAQVPSPADDAGSANGVGEELRPSVGLYTVDAPPFRPRVEGSPTPDQGSATSAPKETGARKSPATPPTGTPTPVAQPGRHRWSRATKATSWLVGTATVGALVLAFGLGRTPGPSGPTQVEPRPTAIEQRPTPRAWQLAGTLSPITDQVLCLAFAPDGALVAEGFGFIDGIGPGQPDKPGGVNLWRVATRKGAGTLSGHTGPVRCVAFAPDGKTLASGAGSWNKDVPGEVKLWDLATKKAWASFAAHPNGVYSLAFHPEGKLLATGGRDDTVKLWDVAAGNVKLRHELTDSRGRVQSVAFSPDGKLLAAGSEDGNVRLWEAATGQALGPLPEPSKSGITGVAFAPNGRQLVAVTGVPMSVNHSEMRLWDVATREFVRVSAIGPMNTYCVAFAPDGKTVVTGCQDQLVRVWEASTGKELDVLKAETMVGVVAFAPDGQTLATGGGWLPVKLWRGCAP